MKRAILIAAGLATVALFFIGGIAFSQGVLTQEQTAQLKSQINAKTGVSWELFDVNPVTGKVSTIGRGYPEFVGEPTAKAIDKAEAESVAVNFVMNIREELGIASGTEIEIRDVEIHDYSAPKYLHRGYSVTVSYRQAYEGIPVYGVLNLVSMTKYGEVYLVKSSWFLEIVAPTTPEITKLEVQQLAMEYFDVDTVDFFEEPKLFILPPENLVWRLQLGAPVHKEVLFDAISGEILMEKNNLIQQIPDNYCYVYGTIFGNRDGQGNNYTGLREAKVKIIDDDPWPLPDEVRWNGFSNNSGQYNVDDPTYVWIWDGIIPVLPADLYVEVSLDGARVRVLDPNDLVAVSTPSFQPESQQTYPVDIQFSSDVQQEASCAYREMYRGWDCAWNHDGKHNKITVRVHYNDNTPWTDGVNLYFPADRAQLPGETMLHEFGHTVMYEKYGNQFPDFRTAGHPGQCTNNNCLGPDGEYDPPNDPNPDDCQNHGGNANGCSADAILEGWANYVSVAVYNADPAPDNPADDTYNWSNSTSSRSLEDNARNDSGQKDEWTIAGILWDIFDGVNATDDDNIELGGGEVWNIFMIKKPYTTKEFYQFAYLEYPDSRAELWEVFSTHGIDDNVAPGEVPIVVSPSDGAVFMTGGIQFTWNSVEDEHWNTLDQNIASGIKYVVQIDMDDDFSSPDEDESGQNSVEVTVSSAGTYYWRVKAVDYAGNSGDFSARRSFTVFQDPSVFAIEKGLAWLKSQQTITGLETAGISEYGGSMYGDSTAVTDYSSAVSAYGSWKFQGNSNAGITALALQAFLAMGHGVDDPVYGSTVESAINYLLNVQTKSGYDNGAIYNASQSYETAMSIVALKSALKTGLPEPLKTNVESALNSALNYFTQDVQSGWSRVSWRYHRGYTNPDNGDMSVSQWVYLALDAMEYSGKGVWGKIYNYINTYKGSSGNKAWIGYYRGSDRPRGNSLAAIWGLQLASDYGAAGASALADKMYNYIGDGWTVNGLISHPNLHSQCVYEGGGYYYYIYEFAKALAMGGKTQFSGENWYEILADRIDGQHKTDASSNYYWTTGWTDPTGYYIPSSFLGNHGGTALALLSLQVGTVPPDSRFIIRLTPVASTSEPGATSTEQLFLNVYDSEGNFAGPDESGNWITDIPNSQWNSTSGIQELEIELFSASTFSVEIHNVNGTTATLASNYILDLEAYQGDNPDPVDSKNFTGTVGSGQIVGTVAQINAIGGLSVFADPPQLFPQMTLSPTQISFIPAINDSTYQFEFTIYEVGDSASLKNIDILASDLVDQFGNILDKGCFSFNPIHIDSIPAGDSMAVQGTFVVPESSVVYLPQCGTFGGSITVESAKQTRSIALVAQGLRGSICGTVSDSLGGLLGVTVDLFDDNDSLIELTATDDTGFYCFDSLIAGDYTVAIVTPIGFWADQESYPGRVVGGEQTAVDFTLHRLEIVPSQRTVGYWMHQLAVHLTGFGRAQETVDDLSRYMNGIRVHFNNNLVNAITIFQVPQPANQNDSLVTLQQLLNVDDNSVMIDKAKQQFIGLILNVVSEKLGQFDPISKDNATTSQAITYCNQLIMDSYPTNDEIAKNIADIINNGRKVKAGIIPLATPNISYKGPVEGEVAEIQLPSDFALFQNYPNPFNAECQIRYALPEGCHVKLSIYNVLGKKVRTLVNKDEEAGYKIVSWDGKDDRGRTVASGVYFYKLEAGEFTDSRKMVLIK